MKAQTALGGSLEEIHRLPVPSTPSPLRSLLLGLSGIVGPFNPHCLIVIVRRLDSDDLAAAYLSVKAENLLPDPALAGPAGRFHLLELGKSRKAFPSDLHMGMSEPRCEHITAVEVVFGTEALSTQQCLSGQFASKLCEATGAYLMMMKLMPTQTRYGFVFRSTPTLMVLRRKNPGFVNSLKVRRAGTAMHSTRCCVIFTYCCNV